MPDGETVQRNAPPEIWKRAVRVAGRFVTCQRSASASETACLFGLAAEVGLVARENARPGTRERAPGLDCVQLPLRRTGGIRPSAPASAPGTAPGT